MRAALRTPRLLARPVSRSSPRRARATDTRCVDASPKDAKRATAGERRLEADAKATAADLRRTSTAASASSSTADSLSPRALRNLTRLSAYATHGDTIKGFFEPGLLRLYLELDAMHECWGIRGALAEIGVFHGKSFMPLALLRQPDERCIAIDCFEDQSANIDASGEGDSTAFRGNVETTLRVCGGEQSDREDNSEENADERDEWLKILEMDSSNLVTNDAPLRSANPDSLIRIFSIDGCHTAEATFADLTVASNAMHPEGVVVVDDVFNPDWPGVVTGLFDWKRNAFASVADIDRALDAPLEGGRGGGDRSASALDWNARGLEPFGIGFGKVFMSRPSARAAYVDWFEGKKKETGVRKTAKFMDRECLVFRHGWISAFHGNE
jgi:hypothetical protein